MIRYTPEQHDILDSMPGLNGIVLVSAGAGTGKSFTAEQLARQEQPKRGLYTAFNKAIVKEGENRFKGLNMECKTFHALAYHYAGRPKNIEDFTYSCIKENISYQHKANIINAMDAFFVSSSSELYEFMEDLFSDNDKGDMLAKLSAEYVEKMFEKEIPPTFNYLLKFFHLMLVDGRAPSAKYDLIVLDEINDVTAVFLEIFKLLDCKKKVGLGETNQAIYQFLNLVDGFKELPDAPVMSLTQSFRCSTDIASSIQNFMRNEVSEKFTFVGTSEPVENGKYLFCTMTNASIIRDIRNRLAIRKGFKLLRDPKDIFACPLALVTAAQGKIPYQKKYKFLSSEYKYYLEQRNKGQSFFKYLTDHIEDKEIINAISLLMFFKKEGINVFDIFKQTKEATVDENYVIATVFTSKGLEFETVRIADDLNRNIQKIRDNGGIQNEEDLVAYRRYYVACSRAGKNLDNARML